MGHGWHFKGSEVHLTDYPLDGSHPKCGPQCRVVSAGTLGAVQPYYVPSQCYDRPTDDHPEKGGFRTELEDAHAACNVCKGKLKQTSPGAYCEGVRDACVMWGHIPKGTDPSKLTQQQIDDCVAQCKTDVSTALVRNFCDTAEGAPSDDVTLPETEIVGDAGSSKKSSALPWVLGALAVGAVGVALVAYGRGVAKANPTSRNKVEPGQRWVAKRWGLLDGQRAMPGEIWFIVEASPDVVVGRAFFESRAELVIPTSKFLSNFRLLKKEPNFSLTRFVDQNVDALKKGQGDRKVVLWRAQWVLAAQGWDPPMIRQAIRDIQHLAKLERMSEK